MPTQKQRYEMPDELLPLWSAAAHTYEGILEGVDQTGFLATKQEAESVFIELRELAESEKSLED